MPTGIFIDVTRREPLSFVENKGKLVVHGESTYLLKEIHRFALPSFAVRASEELNERFVAELRPCSADATKETVAANVKQRVDEAFAQNEFTSRNY